ncbi:MAG: hypothetical protein EB105_00685 [Actinobacteria bacterium]|nr:hypothetical protein [Actinomycetota bacterium]
MADNSVISFADRGDMRAFANSYIPETEIMQRARQRGSEIGTYDTTPAVGSLLRYLAHLIGATSVVEVGTGAGVSGLWILPESSDEWLPMLLPVGDGVLAATKL